MKRLSLALALLPSVAMAHAGDHGAVGFWHLLTETDHLAMVAAGAAIVVLVVAKLRTRP